MPLPDYATLRMLLDGMLLMMILYALFSYVVHRHRLFIFYALYMSTMLLYLHIRAEAGGQVTGWDTGVESVVFLFYIQFATVLMQIRQNDEWSYRTLQSMTWVLGLSGVLSVGLYTLHASPDLIRWTHGVSRLYMVTCTFLILPRLAQLRHPVLPYFIAGTGVFIAFSTVTLAYAIYPASFANAGPSAFGHPLTYMQIGVLLEVLCYTMGISVQNRQTERDKLSFQAQLISQLRENEAKQIRLNALRDEIARDLHDEMGSQLSSISIMGQVTAQLLPPDHRARQRLNTISETARQVMDSMREIVWSLNSNSESLQNVGLRIGETAHALFDGTPIHLAIQLPDAGEPLFLSSRQRRDLYLIAKECLNNIVRHANAQHVRLELTQTTNTLRLCITDDGQGFDPAQLTSGLGMSSLRKRAAQMGSQLQIDSRPGKGTRMELVYPANELTRPVVYAVQEGLLSVQ